MHVSAKSLFGDDTVTTEMAERLCSDVLQEAARKLQGKQSVKRLAKAYERNMRLQTMANNEEGGQDG